MEITTIFIVLFIVVIVFLVLREFWCWYWKINKGITELEKLNENLEQIKTLIVHEISLQENTENDKEDKLPEL